MRNSVYGNEVIMTSNGNNQIYLNIMVYMKVVCFMEQDLKTQQI